MDTKEQTVEPEFKGYDIRKGIAIDPITGKFDEKLIDPVFRPQIEEMAKFMSELSIERLKKEKHLQQLAAKQKLKKSSRKKLPKTFGKNKKKNK